MDRNAVVSARYNLIQLKPGDYAKQLSSMQKQIISFTSDKAYIHLVCLVNKLHYHYRIQKNLENEMLNQD